MKLKQFNEIVSPRQLPDINEPDKRRRGPCGKVVFGKRRAFGMRSFRGLKNGVRIYFCRECNGYHHTDSDQGGSPLSRRPKPYRRQRAGARGWDR